VRRVGRDVDGLTGARDRLFAAEGGFNLAFENGERFLEIMSMGRRSTARQEGHLSLSPILRKRNSESQTKRYPDPSRQSRIRVSNQLVYEEVTGSLFLQNFAQMQSKN
jgi:hypothetical protein